MSINDATNVAAAAALSTSSTVKKSVSKTLSNNIIGKTIQHLTRKRYKCYYGKSFYQLPDDELSELSPDIIAFYSGPDNGIADVNLISHRRLLARALTQNQSTQNVSKTDEKIKENEHSSKTDKPISIQNENSVDSNDKPKTQASENVTTKLTNEEEIKKNDLNSLELVNPQNKQESVERAEGIQSTIQSEKADIQPTKTPEESNAIQAVNKTLIESQKLTNSPTLSHDNNSTSVSTQPLAMPSVENTSKTSNPTEPLKANNNLHSGDEPKTAAKLVNGVNLTNNGKENDQAEKNTTPEVKSQATEHTLVNDCWDSFSKSKITKWDRDHHATYGIACSLYENNLITKTTVGDPIADVFSVLSRQNSSIMILADGVNWGPRSRLAARCAVRAAMNYINKHMFFSSDKSSGASLGERLTTHSIFTIIMKSFDAAQEFILQRKGTMTTLCCSVVLKLKDNPSSVTPLWAVCTLSIGDSTAYVYNKEKGVLELTYGARNINDDRDMRNVGGALGHVYGRKPDVSNLNYSMMYIKEGDIVFLVSDGISDNFDPCVSQAAIRKPETIEVPPPSEAEKPENTQKFSRSNSQSHKPIHRNSLISFASNALAYTSTKKNQTSMKLNRKQNQIALSADDQNINMSTLPQLSPTERYLCGLAHMNEVLSTRKNPNERITAHETCKILIDHVTKITANKRSLLEKGLQETARLDEEEKAKFQACLREKALKLRGKLDHASIVAYDVGIHRNS